MSSAPLTNACNRAMRDSARVSDALIYLSEFACAHNARVVPFTSARASIHDARARIAGALSDAVRKPTTLTCSVLASALNALAASLGAAHDARAVSIMSQTAALIEPSPAPVRVIPHGALDWQTSPSIGADPSEYATGHNLKHSVQIDKPRAISAPRATVPAKTAQRAQRATRSICLARQIQPAPLAGANPICLARQIAEPARLVMPYAKLTLKSKG